MEQDMITQQIHTKKIKNYRHGKQVQNINYFLAGKSYPNKPEFAFFLIVTYTCLGKRELLTVKNEALKIINRINIKRINIKRELLCFNYLNI